MRITGGILAGRKIEPPLSRTTRPMMDRIRQALFNILAHHDWGREIGNVFAETHVLDAFCGTGALAFEAISYGAAHATLFDKDRNALDVATKNAASLGIKNQCDIRLGDATQPARATKPCKLVFLAPPYRKGLIPPALVALDKMGWIAKNPLVLAETAKKEALEIQEDFQILLSRYYADTALHFVTRQRPGK
jgi:16S rRNA (guanine966-N2)-methyltransferase